MINGMHSTVTLEYIKYNIYTLAIGMKPEVFEQFIMLQSVQSCSLWKEFQYKMSASGEEIKLELTIMASYFLTTSL